MIFPEIDNGRLRWLYTALRMTESLKQAAIPSLNSSSYSLCLFSLQRFGSCRILGNNIIIKDVLLNLTIPLYTCSLHVINRMFCLAFWICVLVNLVPLEKCPSVPCEDCLEAWPSFMYLCAQVRIRFTKDAEQSQLKVILSIYVAAYQFQDRI